MSFRSRLTLFFVLIVVVPMVSAAFVLFRLIADNETAKANARLAARQEVAQGFAEDATREAGAAAARVGRDQALADALRGGDRADIRRAADAARVRAGATRVMISRDRQLVTDVGDPGGFLPAARQLVDRGNRDIGRLEVSTETARQYGARVAQISKSAVIIRRDAQVAYSTLTGVVPGDLPSTRGEVSIGGSAYQAATMSEPDFRGRDAQVTLLSPKQAQSGAVRDSRLLAAGVLLGFFILAFTFAVLVSRSLQGQIESLLEAARRLGSGDFGAKVPTRGRDEFAALGEEFNKMSAQLEARLADLRQERSRLQDSLRRIGETFASSLDREGLLEIALRTTLDGIDADGGRATLRREGNRFESVAKAGRLHGLEGALHAAEAGAIDTGRPSEVTVDDVRALAHPLRGDGRGVDGVMAVARRARPFSPHERDLFHYLAGQAAVSIENVGLHETVERQAVTDELTGLSNRRRFDEALEAEVERARRFGQPVGLVLLDLDDFKRVNDGYGHQVGDEVLREVARVLRDSCREIDEPARYGGEELAVVLPGTDLGGAERLAERVRRGVEALEVPLADGNGALRVTTSLGVATLPGEAYDARSLIEAADDALYRAKRTGKNRTVSAS